jgi:hypothetical protein
MEAPDYFFSKEEAQAKIGRKVQLREDVPRFPIGRENETYPKGMPGRVVDTILGLGEYELVIEWEIPNLPSPLSRGVSQFNRFRYERFVTEIG